MKSLAPRLLLCFAGFSIFAGPAQANPQLPDSVRQALKRARIPMGDVGIVVQELNAASPLIAVNATQPMNPASTMKLLTTVSALETLGPAYRWKTEAYIEGKLENGVLDGNLVFKGYGDPKLTLEQFWRWVRELRQRGLRDIRGDIVLDRTFFAEADASQADFDNDPTRAYNVRSDALLLNFNAIHVHLIPNGTTANALVEPELAGYTVQNNVVITSGGRCRGDMLKVRLDGHTIRLDGRIPANCGEVDEYYSLLPHDEYFFAAFSALWKELGGTLQGSLRNAPVSPDAMLYSRYVSPSLAEMIRDINKFSNNIMARQLFLTLGTTDASHSYHEGAVAASDSDADELPDEQGDAFTASTQAGGDTTEGTPSQAAAAAAGELPAAPLQASIPRSIGKVHEWLQAERLQFPELVLENGSGLSRRERINARHLAQVLERVAHSPFAPELEASLPILGMDGTVKRRFRDSDLAGYAHLKTGTLDGVKSLAGFVEGRDGKKWIVVFLINHRHASKGRAAQDALIEWVQRQGL